MDRTSNFSYNRADSGVLKTPLAQVAQLVEQRTENPRVGGSIPPLGTTNTQQIQQVKQKFDFSKFLKYSYATLTQNTHIGSVGACR